MPVYLATQPDKTGRYDSLHAKSIRFDADNRAAAEGYCLMHNLRLDGLFQGEAPAGDMEENDPADDWKKPQQGPRKGDPLLTNDQKATLSILIKKVFTDLDEMGLVGAEGDTTAKRLKAWRYEETRKAVGIASLRECRNSHFRRIHNHFSSMTGKQYDSPQMLATGPQSGTNDTMEQREQAVHLINDALNQHNRRVTNPQNPKEQWRSQNAIAKGGAIGEGYVFAIARGKNKSADLRHYGDLIKLPFSALDQLLSTVRNRIAAREGVGSSSNRNKSQRRKKK